jgi:hypothetical protein
MTIMLTPSFVHTAPDGPPTEARVTEVQPTNISLAWKFPAPELRNGDIPTHSICLRVSGTTAGTCERKFIVCCRRMEYTVADLKPYTNYSFNISAGTRVGFGPPVSLFERTLQTGKCLSFIQFYYASPRRQRAKDHHEND